MTVKDAKMRIQKKSAPPVLAFTLRFQLKRSAANTTPNFDRTTSGRAREGRFQSPVSLGKLRRKRRPMLRIEAHCRARAPELTLIDYRYSQAAEVCRRCSIMQWPGWEKAAR